MMISFIRKPRPLVFQSLIKPLFLNPISTQTLTIANQPNSSDYITPISNLLSQGANWATLTAKFPSIQLDDTQVERILLNFKGQPSDAKKALTFFHWSSQNQNFRHGLHSYCLIVHILVRAGLLNDARALLESSINKNLASGLSKFLVVETILSTYELALPGPRVFDLVVQTYSKMRMVELAYDACCYFGDHGFCLSLASFNLLLQVVQKSDENDFAWKVYEHMIETRVYPNQRTIEIMVDVMCKEGSLKQMIDVLDRIHGKKCGPGVIVNSSLGLRIVRENRIDEGIVLMRRLLQKNLILDDVMISLVIFGYCKMGKLELAYEFYDDLVRRGFSSNAFVHTSFMRAYCKEGKIEEAMQLMEEMASIGLKPYDETYNVLIEGCSRSGRVDDSLDFYDKMLKKGFLPDCATCNEMMERLCESWYVERADEMLTILIDKRFAPNEETYSKLMDGYGKIGKAEEILKLFYEMEHNGLNPGLVVYTSLIRNLCKCEKLKEAEKFLSATKGKFAITKGCIFDAMIEGCCRNGELERALYFYDQMIRKKLEPCGHTFMMLVRSMVEVNTKECIPRFNKIILSD